MWSIKFPTVRLHMDVWLWGVKNCWEIILGVMEWLLFFVSDLYCLRSTTSQKTKLSNSENPSHKNDMHSWSQCAHRLDRKYMACASIQSLMLGASTYFQHIQKMWRRQAWSAVQLCQAFTFSNLSNWWEEFLQISGPDPSRQLHAEHSTGISLLWCHVGGRIISPVSTITINN